MPLRFQIRPHALAAAALAAAGLLTWQAAEAATPADLLGGWRAAAGAEPSPQRGQQLFTTTHGRDWSCASCHGNLPTATGKHANTGKPIEPLAPSVNARRFTDGAKAEKWFRRNCNDVMGRECTAAEKADVLAWLLTVRP